MRMRKKKWAEPFLAEHTDIALPDGSVYKGRWKDLFHTETLHVEIGMGKGDYLHNMARMKPEDGWVGIEKDRSAAAVAARKLVESDEFDGFNERMIVGDAANILDWFEAGEVDLIHLNFSDPWPKTHTHKRRLSSDAFLERYRMILAEHGSIRMKTDNKGLFEDSVLYFLNNGFTFTEFSVDYRRNEHPEDAITEYERRFMDLGQPIYQLCAVMRKEENDT